MSVMKGFKVLKIKEHENRKNIIRESAIQLLNEKLAHEISMRDIAERAGISQSSIYRYYQSQEDLFVEILIEHVGKVGHRLVSEAQNENKTVEEFAINFIDRIFENDAFLQIAGNFMIRGWRNAKIFEKYTAFEKAFMNLLSRVIRNSDIDDKDQKFTKAFLSAVLGIAIALRNNPGLTLAQKRKTMYTFSEMLIQHQFTLELNSS